MRRAVASGALVGCFVGMLGLALALAAAWRCLPYRIAFPPEPWPWVCTAPAFEAVTFLAFPVNLLTDDLSRAVFLSPLTLLTYAALGAVIGFWKKRT
jgi:hypothetical protein